MKKLSLSSAFKKVRAYSMLQDELLYDLGQKTITALSENVPGDFVECGVWFGGASFLMADLLKQSGIGDRKVWMFDSFEGLPKPKKIDGPLANEYAKQAKHDNGWYFDNCYADFNTVADISKKLGVSRYTNIIKGWFKDTLPKKRKEIRSIAVLRVDGDWYSSTISCLDLLYDKVAKGGYVIIDDYYVFDGCAIAVHEFLGKRKIFDRLETSKDKKGKNMAVFIRK